MAFIKGSGVRVLWAGKELTGFTEVEVRPAARPRYVYSRGVIREFHEDDRPVLGPKPLDLSKPIEMSFKAENVVLYDGYFKLVGNPVAERVIMGAEFRAKERGGN